MSSIVAGILRPEQPDATILQLVNEACFLHAIDAVVMTEDVPMHQMLDFILKNDQLIVDVHCGIGYKFLDGLLEYKDGINEFFDRFVIPVKTALYYQERTILTIEMLIKLGVYPEKICILFNADECQPYSSIIYKPSEKKIRCMFKSTIEVMNKWEINVNDSIILPQSDGYIRQIHVKAMKPIIIDIIYSNNYSLQREYEFYLLPDGTNGSKLHKIARNSFIKNIKEINEYIYKPIIKNEAEIIFIKSLIKKGETKSVDFKEELNLKSKKEKAKFITDVIAIANSATNMGYLIIGIRDGTKDIIGTKSIKEETIQQICYRYISPTVDIECKKVNINNKNIALIKIAPNRKPFEVSKEIDYLKQHDAFIRCGTTNQKAPTQDLIEMSKWSEAQSRN